jgi:hypothetical protein
MQGAFNPQTAFLGAIPCEGPKVLSQSVDFSVSSAVDFDMVSIKQTGRLSGIQAIFIDNSNNNQPVSITTTIINQVLQIAAGYQGYFPILVSDQVKMTVASTGNGVVPILFLNFPIAASIWPAKIAAGASSVTPMPVTDTALDAVISGGAVQVNQVQQIILPTNRSGTIAAGGVAQTIMNANANRRLYRIQNIDTTNAEMLWYRDDGASAVIGGAGSFALAAGGVGFVGGYAEGKSQALISIIAATIGHLFTASEY